MLNKEIEIFLKEETNFFKKEADLTFFEIGDGNINYVYRVIDSDTKHSVIVKKAEYKSRISNKIVLSLERNLAEYKILNIENSLAPQYTPKVYGYSKRYNMFAMEDLGEFEILRKVLIQHKKVENLANNIANFLAKTLHHTSDLYMDHKYKKEMVREFINPELCEITENLVFTQPYYDCLDNDIYDPMKSFIKEEIWGDKSLQLEVSKLKFKFMNHTQCLLHGDFHTGSIFIRQKSIKVIDPEFAFFGPGGFDIGNIISNFIFAYINADMMIDNIIEKENYKEWILSVISTIINDFIKISKGIWNKKKTENKTINEEFYQHYIKEVISDAAGYAGCELCRRIIGMAHVEDITSILNINNRIKAETFCLKIAKEYIIHSESFITGKDFTDIIKNASF